MPTHTVVTFAIGDTINLPPQMKTSLIYDHFDKNISSSGYQCKAGHTFWKHVGKIVT